MWPLLCSGPAVSLAASGGVFFIPPVLVASMWKLVGSTAVDDSPEGRRAVDLTHLDAGVCDLSIRRPGGSLPLAENQRLLRVVIPGCPLREAYVRGDDVVADYAASESSVSYQVYWRSLPRDDAGALGIELIVSAQTDRLDADPSIKVRSELAPGELQSGPGWHLVRLDEAPFSYLEMAEASNLLGTEAEADSSPSGTTVLVHQLFPGRLEKGVIRRARLRAYMFPTAIEAAAVAEIYAAFANLAPPLTT